VEELHNAQIGQSKGNQAQIANYRFVIKGAFFHYALAGVEPFRN